MNRRCHNVQTNNMYIWVSIVSIQHILGCRSFKRFQIGSLRHLCRVPQVCAICWEAFWAPKCPWAENQTIKSCHATSVIIVILYQWHRNHRLTLTCLIHQLNIASHNDMNKIYISITYYIMNYEHLRTMLTMLYFFVQDYLELPKIRCTFQPCLVEKLVFWSERDHVQGQAAFLHGLPKQQELWGHGHLKCHLIFLFHVFPSVSIKFGRSVFWGK